MHELRPRLFPTFVVNSLPLRVTLLLLCMVLDTYANTLQENRVTEYLNRTILEIMRTMMHESNLPRNLWPFVVQYTQEILNRLPTWTLSENKTPYKTFHFKKPLVNHLWIFGCWAYVHVPDIKQGKLDAKAVEGHFIDLPQNRKGTWSVTAGTHRGYMFLRTPYHKRSLTCFVMNWI